VNPINKIGNLYPKPSFWFSGFFFSAFIFYLVIGLIAVTFRGCPTNFFVPEPECHPFNKQIEETDPTENVIYQQKIIQILKNSKPEDYRYFFKSRLESDQYMAINFRNDTTCFTVRMNTGTKHKIKGMLRTNGRSYPLEMYDLIWKIDTVNGREEVIYQSMHDIID
jgi:hypothetical protein